MFVLPRFFLCHVLSSSTNNFAHAQTLSRISSLSGRMNISLVNIEFFTAFKKIKQRRISFVLGYLRMTLWKMSTAISIKHRILSTFNVQKKINSDSLYAFNISRDCLYVWIGTFMTLIIIGLLYPSIHNSLIANKRIEVKLAQHMMCAM